MTLDTTTSATTWHRAATGIGVLACGLAFLGLPSIAASAHTDTDLVGVPAGSSANVALQPTHGCSGSPTVEVAIRAPVEGATAVDIDGWTSIAEADGQGNTVLRWTGGSLPPDQTGAFTVSFTAPDTPGELLTFPSVQTCENGEDLAWIDGNPNGDFPAPRLLVLPAGTPAAESIDDVPLDAPGRDLLVEVVDVDGAAASPASTVAETAPATAVTTAAPTTQTAATVVPSTEAASSSPSSTSPTPALAVADPADGGSNVGVVIAIVVGVLVVAGAAAAVLRKRRR